MMATVMAINQMLSTPQMFTPTYRIPPITDRYVIVTLNIGEMKVLDMKNNILCWRETQQILIHMMQLTMLFTMMNLQMKMMMTVN
jgi:hypothetical protein